MHSYNIVGLTMDSIKKGSKFCSRSRVMTFLFHKFFSHIQTLKFRCAVLVANVCRDKYKRKDTEV